MVRLGKRIQPQKADQIRLPPVQLLLEAVLLETVTVEIVTVGHLEAVILGTVTAEHLEAAIPEIATVEHLEAAIPEIATVEHLEVPTAEAIMAEVARVEVQHQVVTVETVEAEIMEVLRRVQTPEAIAERLETVTIQCQSQIVDLELESWIRHLETTQEQVEMVE